MYLNQVVNNLEVEFIKGDQDIDIKDLKYDSHYVQSNDLFICVQGFKTDGHKYIDDVINKKANAVVIDKNLTKYSDSITYIKVPDSRKAMPQLAKNFFEDPLSDINLIGVTGTNGKTTTTYLIKKILSQSGFKTGLIGTIEVFDGENSKGAARTTPESIDIYRHLAEMKHNNVEYAVMEVSSHALALNRVDTMDYTAAVFTNLTQDHLDYHHTMEKYASEKAKLFHKLKDNGTAIINNDDEYTNFFKKSTDRQIITYGIDNSSDLQPEEIILSLEGVKFNLNGFNYDLNLTGKFNIYNSLAAIGVAKSVGISDQVIKDSLESVKGIPGRFETINAGQDFTVIVDYAHTPDSMINVLNAVKNFDHNDIIVVFGCGGERDKGKRPIMGEIAVQKGNYVVVTTDNPRSEDPEVIIEEIVLGIENSKYNTSHNVKVDREDAIYEAINRANKDDVVVIIGKGHETYQVFADKTIDFNDKEVAIEAIKEKMSEANNV
ncbi:MAG TPA: UDP-N-acetylmuramoyl-L-alanyl-D-glutamate--2,6-diaminopimelate ligase [Halanaerobiales bacterium]|nr:UDP-N-acetylmuramoyl-L-alanyl-D-glutamate--2,6-diaminopimelate ligase [Halanaerobiales bacterium]